MSNPSLGGRPSDPDTACFTVHAAAEPSVMARALELFTKRGLIPDFFTCFRHGDHGQALVMDIRMPGLSPATVEYVANCLRQLTPVTSVTTEQQPLELRRLTLKPARSA